MSSAYDLPELLFDFTSLAYDLPELLFDFTSTAFDLPEPSFDFTTPAGYCPQPRENVLSGVARGRGRGPSRLRTTGPTGQG